MTEPAPRPRRLSPARAHLQRLAAGAATAAGAPPSAAVGTEHQLMLAQLYEHRKLLKDLKSVEKKIETKRVIVPDYDAYLDGVLSAGQGADDPIVTTLMVWNIDAGRYERALEIGQYVLGHRLKLPDQYNRDPATLLVDEFATAALGGAMPAERQVDLLSRVGVLTEGADMPDQASARLHKAVGYALIGKHGGADPDLDAVSDSAARMAEQVLSRALALHEQVGVKKDLERLARRLKKAGHQPSDRADPAPGGPVGNGTGTKAKARTPKA